MRSSTGHEKNPTRYAVRAIEESHAAACTDELSAKPSISQRKLFSDYLEHSILNLMYVAFSLPNAHDANVYQASLNNPPCNYTTTTADRREP